MSRIRTRMPEFRGGNLRAYRSSAPEIVLDGTVGTGKTTAVLCKAIHLAVQYPGCRILFVRQRREDFTRYIHPLFDSLLSGLLPGVFDLSTRRSSRSLYRFPGGSEIQIVSAESGLMGGEVDMAILFEATELSLESYERILTRVRGGRIQPQIMCECNPDAPDHWIVERVRAGHMIRFQSSFRDNPRYHLDDGYRRYIDERIQTLTGTRYQRLVLGRWVASGGTLFPDVMDWVVDDADPPQGQTVGGVDFGFSDPFAAVWGVLGREETAHQTRKILRITDERVLSGVDINVHAEALGRPDVQGEHPGPWWCDSSRPDEIRTLCRHGVQARSAVKGAGSIESGTDIIRAWGAGGRLRISRSCQHLIRCLTSLAEHPRYADRPADGQDDHAYDALRYLLRGVHGVPDKAPASAQASSQRLSRKRITARIA